MSFELFEPSLKELIDKEHETRDNALMRYYANINDAGFWASPQHEDWKYAVRALARRIYYLKREGEDEL